MGRRPERALVLLIASLAMGLQIRFLVGSDQDALLTTWVPDDAFYYLLPAWNAAQGLGFSFDALDPTYGFQPLWALVLAALAALAPSKSAFLGAALLLGATLHVGTGLLLYRWFARSGLRAGGVAAAALWLLNPDLVRMQATAMESGLVGVLLLCTLLLLPGRDQPLPPRRLIALGVILGLLVLARLSMVLAAVLVILALLRRGRGRSAAIAGAIALAVCLPWTLYATAALGQPLPASMDRKLVSGIAGAARFVADLPGVPDALVLAMLSDTERALAGVPGLVGPTWERIWLFAVHAPLGWALGSWIPRSIGVGGAILLAGWIGLALRTRRGLPSPPRGAWACCCSWRPETPWSTTCS